MHSDILMKKPFWTTFFTKKISNSNQALFLRRLARFLSRGYPLLDALELISLDPKQGHIAKNLKELLTNGISIDEAFQKQSFSPLAVSFLFFTRSTGTLTESLLLCSDILESQHKTKSELKKVVRYPIFLFTFLVVLLIMVKHSILPSFKQLFLSMHGYNLPPAIEISMSIINIFFITFFSLIIILLLSLISWLLFKNYAPIEKLIAFTTKLPFYRQFFRRYITLLFSLHLSSLLKAGNSIQTSLEIIQQQDHQPLLKYSAYKLYFFLQKGMALDEIVANLNVLEPDLGLLFKRSLQEGTLDADLAAYAELLMELTQTRTINVVNWIQPVLFGCFAIVIVLIYLSIILPMFQWMEQI